MEMGHMLSLSGSSPVLLFNTNIVGRCLITSAPTIFSYGEREKWTPISSSPTAAPYLCGCGGHKYPHFP